MKNQLKNVATLIQTESSVVKHSIYNTFELVESSILDVHTFFKLLYGLFVINEMMESLRSPCGVLERLQTDSQKSLLFMMII
jgi:hypothetical protein